MISFVTLGDAVIDVHGVRVTPVAVKKFALLLVLADARGAIVPRATLCELLFAGLDEKKAQHSLRELAYQLRQLGVGLDGDAHGLVIDKALIRVDWPDAALAPRLDPAILRDIQRGFLPNYAPTLSEAFSGWLDQFRVRVSLDIAKACLREIEVARVAGDWKTAELAARACLALDPLNGHATIALAEVLAITGSATQAANVLDAFANELGPEARKFAVSIQNLRRKIAEGLNRGHARSTFPFAGREDEMRLLSHLLDEAKQAGPRAVLLFGEPGIGKSRIAAEFAARADLEGCAVIRVGAHPYDKQRPMGAFIDIVRLLLKQPGALGCSPESMFWLNRLIGIEPQNDESRPLLPNEDTAHAITRAIVDLVGAIAAETTLVAVIDDAQWIDSNSLHVLRDIVLDSQPSGLLVILTSREERALFDLGDWGDHLVARRIAALNRQVALELLTAELESTMAEAELAEWMTDIANGNPFYVDSLLAHYRTTGERFVVPPQLSAIVDGRIRAVTPEARDLLETIVALGKNATLHRIEKILEQHGAALVRYARELGDARLIIGDHHVEPAHWLISESVQRNVTSLSGRLLYRRIARVMEAELRIEGDSSELWECAQAWVAAGESNHAAGMIANCAEHAQRIGRAREASDLYFRAAGMASSERSQAFAEASIRAAVSGTEAGAVLRAMPLLTSRANRRIHDDIELADLRARVFCDVDFMSTLSALQECLADEDPHHRLAAARALLSFSSDGRMLVPVVDAAASIAALLQETQDFDSPLWLQCAAVFHSICGDTRRVPELVQLIRSRASKARPDVAVELLNVAAMTSYRVGDREQATLLWTRAQSAATAAGLTRTASSCALTLASTYLDAGDHAMAREWFDRVAIPADSDTSPAFRFLRWSQLSVAAEFAVFENDPQQLKLTCERFVDSSFNDLGYRTTRARVILHSLLNHLRGEQQDPQELARALTIEQVTGHEFGVIGDFEMVALITILRDTGYAAFAADQLREYLTERRRPQVAISANLRRVAASIGVTELDRLRDRSQGTNRETE